MSTEKIVVGGVEHEIETKPVTMVFTAPDMTDRISYPGRVPISDTETFYHIDRVAVFHPDTPRMVAGVFGIGDPSTVTPGWCRQAGSGIRHCAGLIDLSLKLLQTGVPFVWIHPESHLHPKAQCGLGDVMIELALHPPKTTLEEHEENVNRAVGDILGET